MRGFRLFTKLLGLRIQSVFRGSGKKTGDGKGIGFKIFIGVMIAYAALCFIGIFGVYFGRLADSFVDADSGFAYFSMVSVIMISIGFVTTVFAAQSQIFEAKDNDLLTSMPIPVRYILLTRIITLLIIEFAESLVIGIEAVVIYRFFAPVSAGGYWIMLLEVVGLNLITASISSLFGLILAAITSKVHRKALVTTVATLVIAAGFFMLINKGENYLNYMLDVDNYDENAAVVSIDNIMSHDMYPFYCFGKGVEDGSIKYCLIFMSMSAVVFIATVFILSPFFLRITATKKGQLRKKYSPDDNRERSVASTLLHKEMRRFFTNASYMLNTGIGLIVLLGGAIALIVGKNKILELITNYKYIGSHIGMFIIFIELFFCAINVISAPSISLEGESLWICKTIPVNPSDILIAKVRAHIIICMPFVVIFGIAANIVLPVNAAMRIAVVLIPAASTVFMGHMGVICNLMLPKFDWADESIAVKQSLAVIATMGIGFGVAIVSFIAYAVIHMLPYADGIYVVLFFAAFVIADICMYRYLKNKGSKRFLEL